MSFRAQIVPASASVLLVGCWIIMTWAIGRRHGIVPPGALVTFLAALYFGYPIWIYSVGKRLRASAAFAAVAA
jgi:hypothetical protein